VVTVFMLAYAGPIGTVPSLPMSKGDIFFDTDSRKYIPKSDGFKRVRWLADSVVATIAPPTEQLVKRQGGSASWSNQRHTQRVVRVLASKLALGYSGIRDKYCP